MYYWAKHRLVMGTLAVIAMISLLSPSSFIYGQDLVEVINEQAQETALVVEETPEADNQTEPDKQPELELLTQNLDVQTVNNGIGNPTQECQAHGFDIGVAKWEWVGQSYSADGDANGTFVSGTAQSADWTATPAVHGIIRKGGQNSDIMPGGTAGNITAGEHDISHLTFCRNNIPTLSIHGVKWNDLNGNSQREDGENGLSDVQITISAVYQDNYPELLGGYSDSTLTDANGHYWFNEVPYGDVYDICEVVPSGWHQTYPLNEFNNCHRIGAVQLLGENGYSYDFGNQIDEVKEPVCGNSLKEDGEQCDDGNNSNGDGCSAQCQLETPQCTEVQEGWWGKYYNLPANHPHVGAEDIPYFPYDDNVHGDPLGGWAPWTADWYDDEYYRFSRVDANLNFGNDFFPMDMLGEEVNPTWDNHDFFFAVHWRAKVTAPADGNYSYSLTSDDDSWVYIDGVRFDDKDGIHPPSTSAITEIPLTAGTHIIDVFYAERHPLGATMIMTLDERLTVMPAPEDCLEENLCGNGVKNQGEQCDDGNVANGDGCSAQCQLEREQICRHPEGSGWWANYYNYSITHPDMELPGDQWPDDGHGNPLGTWDTDWYDPEYYRFSRVESNLNFGDNFFPLDPVAEEVSYGHEFHFGARFRAKVTAPADGMYSYHLRSDDDSWVYIDGALFDATPGVHPPQTSATTQVYLTAGDHIFDIFYAERHRLGASFEFVLDDALTITPAPADCQEECYSPLDFNDSQGNSGPDGKLAISDATEFTQRYQSALGSTSQDSNWDSGVDIRIDGIINAADYLCAMPYYGNAGEYSCQLDCANICHNPLDYNEDYFIKLDDGVKFTEYYTNKTATSTQNGDSLVVKYLADLNSNGQVDYGDYLCAQEQLGSASYQCPIQCAPVCGDARVQARLGEQCDDGNVDNGDGCSSTCQNEGGTGGGPVCGNGEIEEGEQCDDGNITNGDGCSAQCQNEGGTGGGPVCGNGEIEEGEQCDDGNENNGDACSNQCTTNTVPPTSNGGGGGGGGGGGILNLAVRLDLQKTVSSNFTEPGQQLSYTLKVKNTGNIVGTNLKVTDTLPAGFTFVDGGLSTKTWEWPTISIGQEYVVTYLVNVSGSNATGSYLNQAQASVSNGSTAFASASVEIRGPQVQGVEVVVPPAATAPAPEEPVKVLGFEKLPETSGGFSGAELLALFGALTSGLMLGFRSLKRY